MSIPEFNEIVEQNDQTEARLELWTSALSYRNVDPII